MIAALAASILFATSITCGHRAAKIIGGASANFWRLVIATILLGIWSFGFGLGLGGAGFTFFFVSGLLGFGVGDVALYQALPRLGSRLAMLFTQCLAAPFAVIIERVWLGTQLSWLQILCISVILGGVALAIAPHETTKRDPREWRIGALFGVLSGLGGALGAVFSRRAFAAAAGAHETRTPRFNASSEAFLWQEFSSPSSDGKNPAHSLTPPVKMIAVTMPARKGECGCGLLATHLPARR
jgi:drug/metabolite transporter (DMT)-like permease